MEANRLLDLAVDGIITNNTGLIWRTIALRNATPQKQSPASAQ
jgi:hypothetical protein